MNMPKRASRHHFMRASRCSLLSGTSGIEATAGAAGAAEIAGSVDCATAGEGIIDTYKVPNYWYHGYCVYTSSPVGGEFRGFGHPQAVFAREVHIDECADAIGMAMTAQPDSRRPAGRSAQPGANAMTVVASTHMPSLRPPDM